MRTIAWTLAGCLCTFIGLVGLILPIIPGILFLILAAICFERASRSDQRRAQDPGMARSRNLTRDAFESAAAPALRASQRIQLQFWLMSRRLLGKRASGRTRTVR